MHTYISTAAITNHKNLVVWNNTNLLSYYDYGVLMGNIQGVSLVMFSLETIEQIYSASFSLYSIC